MYYENKLRPYSESGGKMKVLIINSVFKKGSTGRICYGIAKTVIDNGGECVVCYGRDYVSDSEIPTYKIGNGFSVKLHGALSRITDRQGFYSNIATQKLIRFIKSYNPDVINLHNLHGYYLNVKKLFAFLKKADVKVVWTLHDCWAFTGHCAYFDYCNCDKWKSLCNNCPNKKQYPKSLLFDNSKSNYKKKKKIFTGVNNLTLVTPSVWLKGLVENSFLSEYKTVVINNGIDLNTFKPTESNYRKENGLEDKKVIFASASVWEDRKGFKFVKEISKTLPEEYKVVVCGATDDMVKDTAMLSVKRTDSVSKLAELYSMADVFINPTLEDNFPSSNIESLACGTPVITFDTGGSGESINGAGLVIKDKTAEGLKDAIIKLTDNPPNEEQCLDVAKKYGDGDKYAEYYRLFTEEKMKVLWLTNLPAPYKVDLFNELGKEVELTVLFERRGATNRDGGWNKNNFENFNGIFLKGIKIGEENSFCKSVKKYLKGKYDKIIIGGYGTLTAMYAIRYLKKQKIKYYLSIDGGIINEKESAKIYKLKRSLVTGAYGYLCPSKKSADFLFYYGADRNKISFYPFTSVKKEDVFRVPEEIKQKLKKQLFIKEDKVILSIGQFIKRKGFDLLIKAAAELKDYGVYIVGGKPTNEYIKLRSELKTANVHFLPFMSKEKTKKYYAIADIFVLPTREDIWGLVVNEAMACGLGVITTDNCIAGLELIKDKENGYIIPTENVEKIIESVNLANEKGFKTLGDKSIELIAEGTIEKEAEVILEILSK